MSITQQARPHIKQPPTISPEKKLIPEPIIAVILAAWANSLGIEGIIRYYIPVLKELNGGGGGSRTRVRNSLSLSRLHA